jgi:hypothetical protein
VDENHPKPFELTNGDPPAEVKQRVVTQLDYRVAIRLWDATYRRRAAKWPVFFATRAEFLELVRPPQLREVDLVSVFGKVPATLNPPEIPCDRLKRLIELATKRVS